MEKDEIKIQYQLINGDYKLHSAKNISRPFYQI